MLLVNLWRIGKIRRNILKGIFAEVNNSQLFAGVRKKISNTVVINYNGELSTYLCKIRQVGKLKYQSFFLLEI